MDGKKCAIAAVIALAASAPLAAQPAVDTVPPMPVKSDAPAPPPSPILTPAPASAPASSPPAVAVAEGPKVDVAAIEVPDLAYKDDPAIEKDFAKYYYFQRDETSFDEAFADLIDCDGLSQGFTANLGSVVPYSVGLADAVGAGIGMAVADAIAGSAQRRSMRRLNMRRCMNFKGYQRYGLPKDIWEKFNFEEGLTTVSEERRRVFLQQQAKVASGKRSDKKVLGL